MAVTTTGPLKWEWEIVLSDNPEIRSLQRRAVLTVDRILSDARDTILLQPHLFADIALRQRFWDSAMGRVNDLLQKLNGEAAQIEVLAEMITFQEPATKKPVKKKPVTDNKGKSVTAKKVKSTTIKIKPLTANKGKSVTAKKVKSTTIKIKPLTANKDKSVPANKVKSTTIKRKLATIVKKKPATITKKKPPTGIRVQYSRKQRQSVPGDMSR
jgi:hypothetical protein